VRKAPFLEFRMSAQIIKLSDRRKARPTTSQTMVDLPISVFAAYAEVSLAIYLSMVDAVQQGFDDTPP
jgi:hypothetical protein